MRIAIAQINCTVGDLSGNAKKILEFTNQAKNKGASLVITPELALSGYPPKNVLLLEGFHLSCTKILNSLVKEIYDISLLLGHPCYVNGRIYNAASLICNGEIVKTYFKSNLLNDDIFMEPRYFEVGSDICTFNIEGIRFGINISTDIWKKFNLISAKEKGVQVLVLLCALPYYLDKQAIFHKFICQCAYETRMAIVCVNLIGGQDELVFDGGSFVVNNNGELTNQLDRFTEVLSLIEFQGSLPVTSKIPRAVSVEENIYRALCLGVRDYVDKNGFADVLLGLSGGVDSALTLTIAVDALGPDRVWAVMMPSEYTSDISLQDSRAISESLGVRYSEISIKSIFDQFLNSLLNVPQWLKRNKETGIAEENLQARIRGNILMTLSNKYSAIVLTTGNKSEMAIGYCTLYGDMAGGLAVLKDISKTMVYKLCEYRNSLGMVIPDRIIKRAPSAELRPNQTDQDSLPPYDVIDGIIEAYVDKGNSLNEIIDMGYSKNEIQQVVDLIYTNEYKRRQSPIGINISQHGFSKNWQYPITSKYKDKV